MVKGKEGNLRLVVDNTRSGQPKTEGESPIEARPLINAFLYNGRSICYYPRENFLMKFQGKGKIEERSLNPGDRFLLWRQRSGKHKAKEGQQGPTIEVIYLGVKVAAGQEGAPVVQWDNKIYELKQDKGPDVAERGLYYLGA